MVGMVSSSLKVRISSVAAFVAVASVASANTPTAWSNPLLRDVPASAKGFISIDLSGSDKALTSVLKLVEGATGSSLSQAAAAALTMLPKAAQDAFAKNFDRRAVTYYNPTGAGDDAQTAAVLVLGLKPGHTMSAALKADTQHDIDGISYADFKDVVVHVEGNTLLLTPSPKNFPEAVKPLRGGPHLRAAAFTHISDSVEPTAEVIGWMDSGTIMSAAAGSGVASDIGLTTGKSFGFSLGLHPKGVSLAVGPLQFSFAGKPLNLSAFRPFPDQFLRTLPGGAYLLTCLANPWPLADKYSLTGKLPESVRSMIDGLKGAVRGNYVLGVYPTRLNNGSPEGVDLLMELRPNEGNDPAGSLGKLMGVIKKAFLPGDISVFESFHVNGADHAYRLNKVVASLMRAGLKSATKSAGGGTDALLREKDLVFAGVGANVLVATSEPVLRKAVAALKYGTNALAYDPKFGELAKDGAKPTQFIFAVSITRSLAFATKILSSMGGKNAAKSVAPGGVPIAMITGFLGAWPDPLMLRLSIQNSGLSGRLFLPVDFATLASFAQVGMKPSR